jgi:hypothetical protein
MHMRADRVRLFREWFDETAVGSAADLAVAKKSSKQRQ